MKTTSNLLRRMKRKAQASHCRTKIVAVGFDQRGKMIGITHNKPYIYKKGGGWHAEELLIRKSPPKLLSRIIIARVSPNTGELRPIEPCHKCKSLAAKYNIKIESYEQ